jgi:outer membrane protein, multidrug efflux system
MRITTTKALQGLLIATVIGGCSIKTPPKVDDVAAKALPSTTIARHWNDGNRTGEAREVEPNRLSGLVSPQLKALIDEALKHNLALRQSASRMLAVAQYVNIAGSRMLPHVNAFASAGSVLEIDNSTTHAANQLGLALGWELDLWGKLRAQKSAQEAHYLSAKLDYAYARQSIIALTAQSWFIALNAQQALDYRQKVATLNRELLALTQSGYRQGKQSYSAVLSAKQHLLNSEIALAEARNGLTGAKRNLEKLLGRYPAGSIAVSQTGTLALPPLAASVPSTLINRRPDLMASYYRVIIAFRNQEVSELNLLPDISLSLEVGKMTDYALSLLNVNSWLMYPSIGMTVPLYEGGAKRAQISIRDAQQQEAVAAYGADLLNAFYQVEQGLTKESTLKKQLALLQRVRSETERKISLDEYRYQEGSIPRQPILQQKIALDTMQYQVQSTHYALFINRITLELALGGVAD